MYNVYHASTISVKSFLPFFFLGGGKTWRLDEYFVVAEK